MGKLWIFVLPSATREGVGPFPVVFGRISRGKHNGPAQQGNTQTITQWVGILERRAVAIVLSLLASFSKVRAKLDGIRREI
jgi:hypothetical protein